MTKQDRHSRQKTLKDSEVMINKMAALSSDTGWVPDPTWTRRQVCNNELEASQQIINYHVHINSPSYWPSSATATTTTNTARLFTWTTSTPSGVTGGKMAAKIGVIRWASGDLWAVKLQSARGADNPCYAAVIRGQWQPYPLKGYGPKSTVRGWNHNNNNNNNTRISINVT